MSTLTRKQKLIKQINKAVSQLDDCELPKVDLNTCKTGELNDLLKEIEKEITLRKMTNKELQLVKTSRVDRTLGKNRGVIIETLRRKQFFTNRLA